MILDLWTAHERVKVSWANAISRRGSYSRTCRNRYESSRHPFLLSGINLGDMGAFSDNCHHYLTISESSKSVAIRMLG